MIVISDGAVLHKILNADIYNISYCLSSSYESEFGLNPEFVTSFSQLAANSLIIATGNIWKIHRKIITGSFAPAQLRLATEVICKLLDRFMSHVDKLSAVRNHLDFEI